MPAGGLRRRTPSKSRLGRAFLAGALLGSLGAFPSPRAEDPAGIPLEHQVKIAFLYNFAKFVEWPPDVFSDGTGPLVIGILGTGPLCDELETTLQGKMVNARSILVKRFRPGERIEHVQILFVSPSIGKELPHALGALRGAAILSVGDTDGFTALGGMINFRIEENRVRFDVNIDAAELAGLKISSKLLTVARVVRVGSTEGRN